VVDGDQHRFGLYWGALYRRYRSVLLIGVSHSVWDIVIFLAFPLG